MEIHYTANPQTTEVVYVDHSDHEKVVKTVEVKGTTGSTTPVPAEGQKIPAGYELVPGETVPTSITFKNDGSQTPATKVELQHQTVKVTPASPKTTEDKLPDNPTINYPEGVGEKDLTKVITRTIRVHNPAGGVETTTQTVKLTRSAMVDEVTGKVINYTAWTTGNWEAFTAPVIFGYTPDNLRIPAVVVTSTTSDSTIDIYYVPDSRSPKYQRARVIYVDRDQQNQVVAQSPWLVGKSGDRIDYSTSSTIKSLIDKGYELVEDKFPFNERFDFDDQNDQIFLVELKHDPQIKTQTKITRQIIHYRLTDGGKAPADHYQTAIWHRQVVVDLVNGRVEKATPWRTRLEKYAPVESPEVSGYIASEKIIPAMEITMTDQNFTVSYRPMSLTSKVKKDIPKWQLTRQKIVETEKPIGIESTRTTIEQKEMHVVRPTGVVSEKGKRMAPKLPQTGDTNGYLTTLAGLCTLLLTVIKCKLKRAKRKMN